MKAIKDEWTYQNNMCVCDARTFIQMELRYKKQLAAGRVAEKGKNLQGESNLLCRCVCFVSTVTVRLAGL